MTTVCAWHFCPKKKVKGMAEMFKRFHEGGNELYVGANGRKHD